MTRMTGGQAIVRSLKQYGIDTIFALPGIQLDHFFNALYDEGNSIRAILIEVPIGKVPDPWGVSLPRAKARG